MTTPHTPDMFETLEQTTRLVEENNPDEAYRVMKDAVAEDSQGFARMFLSQWMKHMENASENIKNKFSEILAFLKEDYPEPAPEPEQTGQQAPTPATRASAMPVWLAPLDKPRPPVQKVEPQKTEPEPEKVQPVREAAKPEVKESEPVEPSVAPQPAPPSTTTETVEPEVAEVKPEPEPKDEPQVEAAEAEPVQPVQEEEAVTPEPETVPEAPAVTTPTPEPTVAPEPEPVSAPKSQVVVELEQEELESLTLTFYEWQMTAIAKAAMKEKVDENVLLKQMLQTRNLEPLMWSRYRKGTPSPTKRITIAVPHEIKATIEEDKHAEGMKTTTRYVRKVLFGKRAEKA